MDNQMCNLGCGKIATTLLKNGKWICGKSINTCETQRKKNSMSCVGIPKPTMRGENHPRPMKGKSAWNSGMTKGTNDIIKEASEKISRSLIGKSHPQTVETRKKISKTMTKVGGGYRKNSGRGKQGWYKGFYCQSSWELAWVIYSMEHGIKFVRNNDGFEYEFENKKHRYYPDFIMEDGSYTEVKGYNSKQWEAKKTQFPHKLLIIGKEEIKPYINYVVEKYGKDFIRLYESTDNKVAGEQPSP